MEFSVGVKLARHIAGVEALRAQGDCIEPGHLLIGVCSLEKVLPQRSQSSRGASNMLVLEAEAIAYLLEKHGVTPPQVRREVRAHLVRGQASHFRPDPIRRSLASKAASSYAVRFAREANAPQMACTHLLAGLLQSKEALPVVCLARLGVDVDKLAQEARDYPLNFPQESTVADADSQEPSDSILETLGKNLCELALEGKFGECIGRPAETLRLIQILSRGTKNNALIIGEPGVGKTALVEGLAWRIAHRKDPALSGRQIIEISLAALVAGTKYRGELEERLNALVKEAARRPEVILFIDEFHTLQSDPGLRHVANFLKPALARGEIRCLGTTTWQEFRRYIEPDAALERRFQPVTVEEPSIEVTRQILETAYRARFERQHNVTIDDSALQAACALSARYLPDRRLPDKAIDLLDETCIQVAVPKLGRDSDAFQILPAPKEVSARDVARVLSAWVGFSVAPVESDERQRLLGMADELKRRVIGQDHACEKVAEMIQRARVGLKQAHRPIAVLLFVGPTGIGKTELAKATAGFLFGAGSDALLRFDMSEYMEAHSISRLIGAPPGFIGHDEDPRLILVLRKRPFSVVLLDEVEKAHPDVLNLFLQLFDEGRLTDAKGRTADGSHALFILTSNLVTPPSRSLGFGTPEEQQGEFALDAVRKFFRPELLNRIDAVIPFQPLESARLKEIAALLLRQLQERLDSKGILLEIDASALDLLVRSTENSGFGARALRRTIEQQIESRISALLLRGEFVLGTALAVRARDGRFEIVPAKT